ncbi:MAG: metallophosphoesterase [Clostridia bacterium]|nr:metallophosphoesterase [Clostridia bacterium]
MSFLSCTPSVFVIGQEYEILLNAESTGIFIVNVDGEMYYEENSGVLSSEKKFAKIRIPQSKLNAAKEYEVIFRETIERKAYFSKMKPSETQKFSFRPLEKEEDIHIYHVADVHYRFDLALKTATYFKDDLDVLVVNGDIGEVETEENYFMVCKFVGDVSKGEVPVIFVRGNHDTRGKLAERFVDYFPAQGKNTYFQFSIGCLGGVALDCGEDKWDNHIEYGGEGGEVYGGVNVFEVYRRQQLQFLKDLTIPTAKFTFAVTHICPVMTTYHPGDCFDIERDVYAAWNTELERLGTQFMLCGHYHKAFIIPSDSPMNTLPHAYPVIVGSECSQTEFIGAAITLKTDAVEVLLTNTQHEVVGTHRLPLGTNK